MVVTASRAARMTSACRQPTETRSQASMGMKIVLAKPAAMVTVRRARSRPVGNHCTMAAKAGS
jgi:hypothetical protein